MASVHTLARPAASLLLLLGSALAGCAGDDADGPLSEGEQLEPGDAPAIHRHSCATAELGVLERDALTAEVGARLAIAPAFAPVTIPVHFHVIRASSVVGDVPDAKIAAQIAVLNQAYAGTGFSFQLVGTDRTTNVTFFNLTPGSTAERQMKEALHKGGATTLNLYSTGVGGGLTGWGSFPANFSGDELDDGVVIHYGTLPGGSEPGLGQGHNAVHQTGHWLGLYHPFQGGCSSANDHVSDTPAEQSPAFGCPIGRNTCAAPGLDPIHNFMDYTDDWCTSEFTPGQVTRMRNQFDVFRRPDA